LNNVKAGTGKVNWANLKTNWSKKICMRLWKLHSFRLVHGVKRPRVFLVIYAWVLADVEICWPPQTLTKSLSVSIWLVDMLRGYLGEQSHSGHTVLKAPDSVLRYKNWLFRNISIQIDLGL
jgi:hypothetical protein